MCSRAHRFVSVCQLCACALVVCARCCSTADGTARNAPPGRPPVAAVPTCPWLFLARRVAIAFACVHPILLRCLLPPGLSLRCPSIDQCMTASLLFVFFFRPPCQAQRNAPLWGSSTTDNSTHTHTHDQQVPTWTAAAYACANNQPLNAPSMTWTLGCTRHLQQRSSETASQPSLSAPP